MKRLVFILFVLLFVSGKAQTFAPAFSYGGGEVDVVADYVLLANGVQIFGSGVINTGGCKIIQQGLVFNDAAPVDYYNKNAIYFNLVETGKCDTLMWDFNFTSYVTFRAYFITDCKDTVYSDRYGFTPSTPSTDIPTVTTASVSAITSNSATSGGNVTADGGASVTEKGVCWNTTGIPDINDDKTSDGTGTGSFTSSLTGLTSGTTYYIRAYATNSVGTAYGSQLTFTTLSVPTVTTASISNLGLGTADGGGNVTADGGSTVTDKGIAWNTTGNPTIANDTTIDGSGTGSFISNLTGLVTYRDIYYVRAYATNGIGTAYGNQVSFYTATVPGVIFSGSGNRTASSVDLTGAIEHDGEGTVSEVGFYYDINPGVTSSDNQAISTLSGGVFTETISGLSANTTYYGLAYGENEFGVGYSDEFSFSTTPAQTTPTVLYVSYNNLTTTSVTLNGNVTDDGNATMTVRGFVIGTSSGVNLGNGTTVTDGGSSTGAYSLSASGLTPNTTYYVKAYAINSVGTAYSSEYSFTTLSSATLPTVATLTTEPSSTTSISSGGNVTADGGASITARGVCVNTTGTPTLSDTYTTNGTGTGSFSSELTGLSSGSTYYIRAYATNSVGTSYGIEKQIPLSKTVACSSLMTYSGSLDYPYKGYVVLGSNTGQVNVTFQPYSYPDLVIIILDGSVVLSTGYLGDAIYDIGGLQRTQFTDALDGKEIPGGAGTYPNFSLYPSDGYPPVNSAGSMSFGKTTSATTATVYVYAPMTGTAWDLTLSCPF